MKKLGSHGFAHYFIIAIITVVAIGGIGSYVVIKSKAADLDSRTNVNRRAQPRVLIIGDSITANYVDASKHGRGWWTYLADATGAKFLLSAQGGSGYVRVGRGTVNKECHGTAFGQRLADIKKYKPDYIIIEGGRNDAHYCVIASKSPLAVASTKRITQDVNHYFKMLIKAASAQGVPTKNIYAFTPWGPDAKSDYDRVWPIISKQAKKVGITYVKIPRFDKSRTLSDGMHPNSKGSKYIFNKLAESSFVDEKLRGDFSTL